MLVRFHVNPAQFFSLMCVKGSSHHLDFTNLLCFLEIPYCSLGLSIVEVKTVIIVKITLEIDK